MGRQPSLGNAHIPPVTTTDSFVNASRSCWNGSNALVVVATYPHGSARAAYGGQV